MTNIWLAKSRFPIGSVIKVIKPCVFHGFIGQVVGYEPDLEEMIEIEFAKGSKLNGKAYDNLRGFLSPHYIEKQPYSPFLVFSI